MGSIHPSFPDRRAPIWRAAVAAWLLSVAASAVGAQPPSAVTTGPRVVAGRVIDAAARTPVAAAEVRLGSRSTTTDEAGRFALAAGDARLVVRRLGYRATLVVLDTVQRPVGDTLRLDIPLTATAMTLATVTVDAARRTEAVLPATVLDGVALDRALAPSIAATIAGEPGITTRYNGPLATQPVIRGLTGDRVTMLEDGLRTGDIATTAPDHAVTIDPITARRVEVVRGPAALRYAANVLGGVVNVVRDDVPRVRPARLAGHVGTQGESVNGGGVIGGGVSAPAGPLTLRVTGSARTAGDTRTPGGALPFTDLDGFDVGVGAGRVWSDGFAGAAVRDVRTFYGVPSSFGGATLPGSHDGGVYVDLRRSTARAEGEWRRAVAPDGGGLTGIAVTAQGIRFAQEELERGGFVGTRFGQLAAMADVAVRYRRRGAIPGEGTVGLSTQWRDFRAEGSFTGTRPAVARTLALFATEEVRVGRAALSIGGRVDDVQIRPLDSTETRLLTGVRTRRFRAATGALAGSVDVGGGLSLGATAARAFRPPAIEELYSAGPHLATYAYEIGNPRLRAEQGWGTDLFARLARPRLTAEVAAYAMWIDGFVYQSPRLDPVTGAPLLDPRLRRYQVYQASQTDARLTGVEGRLQWELARAWALDGTLSVARGTRTRGDSLGVVPAGAPLPAMPPIRGRLQLRRDGRAWLAGMTLEAAAAQSRIPVPTVPPASCTPGRLVDGVVSGLMPAEFCPTAGFTLVHLVVGRRWLVGNRMHSATLAIDNLFDATWRDHLWRAKQVAPQPGRNLRLLYRLTL